MFYLNKLVPHLARHGEDAPPLKPSSFVRWLERDQTAVFSAARLSTHVENPLTAGLSKTKTSSQGTSNTQMNNHSTGMRPTEAYPKCFYSIFLQKIVCEKLFGKNVLG
jgi:hypothetical protein